MRHATHMLESRHTNEYLRGRFAVSLADAAIESWHTCN